MGIIWVTVQMNGCQCYDDKYICGRAHKHFVPVRTHCLWPVPSLSSSSITLLIFYSHVVEN